MSESTDVSSMLLPESSLFLMEKYTNNSHVLHVMKWEGQSLEFMHNGLQDADRVIFSNLISHFSFAFRRLWYFPSPVA